MFNADLPSSVNSVTIPSEFLEPGAKYKLEVQAIDRSENLMNLGDHVHGRLAALTTRLRDS